MASRLVMFLDSQPHFSQRHTYLLSTSSTSFSMGEAYACPVHGATPVEIQTAPLLTAENLSRLRRRRGRI